MSKFSVALICLGVIAGSTAHAATGCEGRGPLTIVSATDDGMYEETHGPENTIDGDFDPDSRWSNESEGGPKTLLLDLGAEQTVKALQIAWYKGDSRKSTFSIAASPNGKFYQTIVQPRQSEGTSLEFETYDFSNKKAQFVRIISDGNESNDWNSIVEVAALGCGVAVEKPAAPILTERQGQGMFGLDPKKSPGENFDLSGWYVTTPADDNGDGKSDSVYENELAAGWTDPRYFYTDPATGGMVFRVTPAGAKTSKNTSYTRTELRGMLRRGDYTIQTRADGGYPNKNNWVFSSAPAVAQAEAGGVNGVLKATLSVNQVTRQGKNYQVGRVVIGQIHAKNDEPIRLYYRKLPHNKFGSIYFAHDPEVGKETWVEVIGSRANKAKNPEDGIALDEVFSYVIEVKGKPEGDAIIPMLHLQIIRDDGSVVEAEPFDMRDSGFSVENEFMFFKAGAYTGNNTSPQPETDFDKVIFYALDHSHDPVTDEIREQAAKELDVPDEVTVPNPAVAGVLFDDSFADGDRSAGGDPMDANWWATTTSSAIEIAPGALGLVSGSSGRGIRTTFAPQTLSQGQSLKAQFTFTTPETLGRDRDSAFRIGLHDKLDREGLEADLGASSKQPNKLYNNLPGYMIDFDVNLDDPSLANIDIRKQKPGRIGRLMGTTKAYKHLAGGGEPYQFAAGEVYTGEVSVQKQAEGVKITGTLSQDGAVLTTFTHMDLDSQVNNFGMLSFHVNSVTFGTSNEINSPDNGLDFSNVRVEILP
ncbi:polysaccharide lyase family 7 protein [Algirhabdus cladophorae]|uniref:polysaccharide lyase family 7 protein n=1 Tax=Algirhabdus cladophorae TaxID=3377108 RepID=UPI003B847181